MRLPASTGVLFAIATALGGALASLPGCGGGKKTQPPPRAAPVADGGCTSDADCKNGGACADGKCGPPRDACRKDEDCADDEDCVNGRCSRLGRDGAAGPCVLEPVYFGFDTSQIGSEARVTLERDAACLQRDRGRGVMLVGHTDPRGTEEYNIALSENRAQSVGDFLSRLGVDPARFRVVPKGENEATGADESSFSQDRRVELEWQ